MGVRKYTKEVIKEGKRVRWPKKDIFVPALVTTLVICVLCAGILMLEDLLGNGLITALKNVFKGLN